MYKEIAVISLFIILASSFVLSILELVWITPVMKNSKKEPLFEIGSSLLPKYEHKGSLAISEGNCEKYLYNSLKNGVYETFNFKMKEIHKYSTGIFVIFIYQISFGFCLAGIFYASAKGYDIDECQLVVFVIGFIITLLLNFIFFILFSVFFYKRKIDEFKDFSKCSFFDETNFNYIFGFVFSVYKNGKKAFIVDLLFVIWNFISLFILIFLLCKERN